MFYNKLLTAIPSNWYGGSTQIQRYICYKICPCSFNSYFKIHDDNYANLIDRFKADKVLLFSTFKLNKFLAVSVFVMLRLFGWIRYKEIQDEKDR